MKRSSTVPCRIKVGTFTRERNCAGPRLSKKETALSLIVPVVFISLSAAVISGSSFAVDDTLARMLAQPVLGVSFLSRLVPRECQAIVGAMASIRQSRSAAANWTPPP